jgi:hypothetical protein
LIAVLAVLATLVAAGIASADRLRYGVADDWPKFHPCGDVWWRSAKDIGYQDLRMTVLWNAAAPTVIPFESKLKNAVNCAKLNNIRPILAVYPASPSGIGSRERAQTAFASFVGLVGQDFAKVRNFIVGNEPNVNRFWRPQYVNGLDAAATDYEHTLARSYDALKAVRPDSIVWGPAISSRGNDNATALSNPSHSPVRFIKDLGVAYRASTRRKRIFDEFDLHAYPRIQDTDRFSKTFDWPRAGAANLGRIKQALWDAFHGTGQPTVMEHRGTRTATPEAPKALPIDLDEAGEQTAVSGHEGAYDGTSENVKPISEKQQSRNHVELAEIAACDPAVKALLYFPLIDERAVSAGFQSGNLFADFAAKESYTGLETKIASAHGLCQGGIRGIAKSWSHTTKVIGAADSFALPGGKPGKQPTTTRPASATYWALTVTAGEDATFHASLSRIFRAGTSPEAVLSAVGGVNAYQTRLVKFTPQRIPPGVYRYRIRLAAAMNPQRTTTLTSQTFTVRRTGT